MINKAYIAVKIKGFIENGRQEVTTKKELEKYPIGSLVSYLTKDGVLRTAGFITKFMNDYFQYMKPEFGKKYRARYNLISKIFVGDVYKTHNDIVSISPPPKSKKTNFPVKINGIVVYYGQKTFDQQRFMETDKYKRIIKWVEYFENDE